MDHLETMVNFSRTLKLKEDLKKIHDNQDLSNRPKEVKINKQEQIKIKMNLSDDQQSYTLVFNKEMDYSKRFKNIYKEEMQTNHWNSPFLY